MLHALTRGDLLHLRYLKEVRRLEDRAKRSTLLRLQWDYSVGNGNISGDEAEVSRGRENLSDEVESDGRPALAQCRQGGIREFYF